MLRVLPRITQRTISLNRCLKSSSSYVQNKKEKIHLGVNESSQPKSQLKSPCLADLSADHRRTIEDRPLSEQLASISDSNVGQSIDLKTGQSTNLKADQSINSNASESSNDLNANSTNPNADQLTTDTNKPAIDSNVSEYDTVEDWLSSIRSRLVDISPAELNTIYVRMMQLFRRQQSRQPSNTVHEFKKELTKSPDYWHLIDRTKRSMNELSNMTLINLLRWFSMTGESTQSPLYLDTREQLNSRVDRCELSVSELVEALFVMHFHVDGAFADQRLVKAASDELLKNNQIEDVDTITKAIFLFLMPDYDGRYKVTRPLIASLLSPDVQLNYRQSVMLLRRLKQASEMSSAEIRRKAGAKSYRKATQQGRIKLWKKGDDFRYFPAKLAGVIDKCNEVIQRQFTEEPSDEHFDFYLSHVHDSVDPLNHEFPNFYAPDLFAPLRDFLLSQAAESADDQRRYDLILYNLTTNYYRLSTTFDEALLRRLHEMICSNEQMPGELANPVSFYFLISKYRLPWVQHDLLASRLFAGTIEKNCELAQARRLLAELILNDVQDVRVLDYVCEQIQNLSSYHVSTNEYKLIALARVYFSMFGQMRNGELKAKIERKLNQIIFDYSGNKPKLSEKYIRFAESKVQKNGFLSNGMYVKGFGIYDRLKADFVSLADQEKYFSRVDRMPIEKHQEL